MIPSESLSQSNLAQRLRSRNRRTARKRLHKCLWGAKLFNFHSYRRWQASVFMHKTHHNRYGDDDDGLPKTDLDFFADKRTLCHCITHFHSVCWGYKSEPLYKHVLTCFPHGRVFLLCEILYVYDNMDRDFNFEVENNDSRYLISPLISCYYEAGPI